ncbi:hypothetical protein BH09ACT13_BH09ACT13_10450 [soil metagenome]
MEAAEQRQYAVSLFNRTWDLLELSERTPEQIDEMIHIAHASCYHWGQVGAPANGARGEWQCARVYATLGQPEPALWHARRCLEIVEAGGEGLEDWDLPSAQQALAHALSPPVNAMKPVAGPGSRKKAPRASRTTMTAS